MTIDRKVIIRQGVKNLREFGYPSASEENILTDRIYSQFFRGMLEDNKGKGSEAVDLIIEELIAEIDAQGKA